MRLAEHFISFATSLINTIKHEHSCKILYVILGSLYFVLDFVS